MWELLTVLCTYTTVAESAQHLIGIGVLGSEWITGQNIKTPKLKDSHKYKMLRYRIRYSTIVCRARSNVIM